MTRFAEGALNQTRFHALFEAAGEGMVVIGPDGVISDVNPALEQLFGYTAEELVGNNVSILMPEPDRSHHDEYIRRYRHEAKPRIIGIGREVVGRHKAGHLFPVYLSVGEFKTPTLEGYVGILRDLTETKATADTLERTKAELESTLQFAPVAILTLDHDGLIQKSNDAARSMLCLPAEDGERNIIDYNQGEARQQQLETLGRVWRGEVNGAEVTLTYTLENQQTLQCRGHYALVRSPHGMPSFIILELADLTPLVNAEQEAASHREQLALAGRVESLGEMAASIAHELNQPLAAITLYAQTASRLLDNTPSADGQLEAILEKIAAQALRAGQVIKQVRALVGKSEHETEVCDFREIAQEALRLGEVDARASSVQLNVDMPTQAIWVNADAIQMQQVLLNLLRNAFDALTDARPVNPTVHVRMGLADGQALIEVCDNGPGVDADIVDVLFQPFVTSKQHGMGIGLSLSHSIVKRHHGTLCYDPASQGGACFKMTLPITDQAN